MRSSGVLDVPVKIKDINVCKTTYLVKRMIEAYTRYKLTYHYKSVSECEIINFSNGHEPHEVPEETDLSKDIKKETVKSHLI